MKKLKYIKFFENFKTQTTSPHNSSGGGNGGNGGGSQYAYQHQKKSSSSAPPSPIPPDNRNDEQKEDDFIRRLITDLEFGRDILINKGSEEKNKKIYDQLKMEKLIDINAKDISNNRYLKGFEKNSFIATSNRKELRWFVFIIRIDSDGIFIQRDIDFKTDEILKDFIILKINGRCGVAKNEDDYNDCISLYGLTCFKYTK